MLLAHYIKTLQLLIVRWSLSKSLPIMGSLLGLSGGIACRDVTRTVSHLGECFQSAF